MTAKRRNETEPEAKPIEHIPSNSITEITEDTPEHREKNSISVRWCVLCDLCEKSYVKRARCYEAKGISPTPGCDCDNIRACYPHSMAQRSLSAVAATVLLGLFIVLPARGEGSKAASSSTTEPFPSATP